MRPVPGFVRRESLAPVMASVQRRLSLAQYRNKTASCGRSSASSRAPRSEPRAWQPVFSAFRRCPVLMKFT